MHIRRYSIHGAANAFRPTNSPSAPPLTTCQVPSITRLAIAAASYALGKAHRCATPWGAGLPTAARLAMAGSAGRPQPAPRRVGVWAALLLGRGEKATRLPCPSLCSSASNVNHSALPCPSHHGAEPLRHERSPTSPACSQRRWCYVMEHDDPLVCHVRSLHSSAFALMPWPLPAACVLPCILPRRTCPISATVLSVSY